MNIIIWLCFKYLNHHVFDEFSVYFLVVWDIWKSRSSSVLHGIHCIILCLKNFYSGCIQLCWVFTVHETNKFFCEHFKNFVREIIHNLWSNAMKTKRMSLHFSANVNLFGFSFIILLDFFLFSFKYLQLFNIEFL